MSESNTKTIYEKISAIRKMVEALRKNKDGYGYKYVSDDEILAKVTAGLEKYKLDVYPRIRPGTTVVTPYSVEKNKVLKNGDVIKDRSNEIIVQSDMEFEWIDLENPESRIVIPWAMVGQQSDASQAFGSGLTYCNRYFFLKFFKSSTVESDPDLWRAKQSEARDFEEKLAAQEIIKVVDEICKKNTNEDNRDGLTDIIKGVVVLNGKSSANYSKVEDPEMAARLLDAVKKYFNIEV